MQDCVFDIPEHKADVFRVNGRGEVMVKGFSLLVTPFAAKAFHQEFLNLNQIVGVTIKIGKIVLDGDSLDLLFQQVCLIEKENDGGFREHSVVDDGVEYVK